jgi:drug/metabolite transporter (DMT)-like permease
LVIVMLVVGVVAALHGAIRHSGPPMIDPLSWLAVPLFDMPVFAGLIAAGLYTRQTPQTHKRLMLIATVGLIAPAVGRMAQMSDLPLPFPMPIIGAMMLFLLALALWDRRNRGRIHRATVIGGGVLIASWPLRLAIWDSGPWMAFADQAVDLVR